MIKNETNRFVKPSKPLGTTTPASIHQKSTALISNDPIVNRKANTDTTVMPPLSKLDIIKKFDNKAKEPSLVQLAPELAKISSDETKHDEEEQAHSSNSDEFDNDSGSQSDNNNSCKNGHGNGNGSNNSGPVPPKPLPRTSRNNSISSISSEHGSALSIAAANEEVIGGVRPVAKPRTTTASYKVAICSSSKRAHYFSFVFSVICFVIYLWHHSVLLLIVLISLWVFGLSFFFCCFCVLGFSWTILWILRSNTNIIDFI